MITARMHNARIIYRWVGEKDTIFIRLESTQFYRGYIILLFYDVGLYYYVV